MTYQPNLTAFFDKIDDLDEYLYVSSVQDIAEEAGAAPSDVRAWLVHEGYIRVDIRHKW